MKDKLSAFVLAAPIALITLTGCSMNSDETTIVGTSTSMDAANATEKVSSGIYDLIGVKGKTSDSQSGVSECSGKDEDKYFRIFHPWSFYPTSASDLEKAMKNLRAELPKHGWKIVEYGPDTSKHRNINLTADNDQKKVSVNIVQMLKNDPPKLSLTVVTGCYKVPDGQKVQHF
ncbi:hypothetical protein ACIHEJ_15540 [Streptomyces sp. NPDC052301]|uniref:hypothetical protein n=1 Tax=Streptomyces sp. NPDC052301 TaxID=3365687 RepID=UPI0037D77E42